MQKRICNDLFQVIDKVISGGSYTYRTWTIKQSNQNDSLHLTLKQASSSLILVFPVNYYQDQLILPLSGFGCGSRASVCTVMVEAHY